MKNALTVLAVVALIALVSAPQAGAAPIITMDENGHATLDGNPVGYIIGLDPGPGGLPNALIYQFQLPGLAAGDLIIYEPSTASLLSDLVRFNEDGNIVFYSEYDPEEQELADIGFPTGRYTNLTSMQEEGSETWWNGATYTPPGSGWPGYTGVGAPTYIITSDTPEPATLTLLVAGGLGILLRRRAR